MKQPRMLSSNMTRSWFHYSWRSTNSWILLVATNHKNYRFSINYFFDASTSTKEANETLFVCELSIFHHVIVWEEEFFKPLTWWKDHADRFSTITFLAKQIVWITSSQIEIKKIFLVVRLFKSLWHCYLESLNYMFLWWFTRIGQMMPRMIIFWPQIIIQL